MTKRDLEINLLFLEKYGSSPQILSNTVNLNLQKTEELNKLYLKYFDKIPINDKK